jgi:hypothetical protein
MRLGVPLYVDTPYNRALVQITTCCSAVVMALNAQCAIIRHKQATARVVVDEIAPTAQIPQLNRWPWSW